MLAPLAFDPATLGRDSDPYPQLGQLREAGPALRLDAGFWAITGYAEALAALKARQTSSALIAARFIERLPEGAAREEMVHRINFLDPPDHTRVRGLVKLAFTPRRIEALTPWIERTARELIDGLDGHGRIDLLSGYAHQLPSLVISELLGIPATDRDRLTVWSDAVVPLLGLDATDDQTRTAVAASEQLHAYLAELIEQRSRKPGEDLLSALIAAEQDGERLSRPELMSLVATLYSAGHRTTRDLFTNGMSVLLEDPQRYRRVVAGEWICADVVEEMLRYVTPTLFVVRVPSAELQIGAAAVPAGEPMLVYLAGANRDPAVYEQPDSFRPGRLGPKPLSFAHGAHFCLGAALARAEAAAMLAALAERWPALALAEPQPRWVQRGTFRGLDALWVRPRG